MRQLKIGQKITTRESMALEKYLNEIAKIPMVSIDEETRLAKAIRNGEEGALDKLVKANLRFVVSVAKQYQNQGMTLGDLINEGNVGLMKAANRFDETKGFKFISYAVWWIRQSILHAITENSRIVRMPVNKVTSFNKVNDAYISFLQEFEREPSADELAGILDITPKEVSNMMRMNVHHVSMDAPLSNHEDNDSTMLDMLSDQEDALPDFQMLEDSLKQELQESLSVLSPREIEVLSAMFGLNGFSPMKMEEIGERFGLTRERVRQIKERAIRRLQRSHNKNILRSYL
jgi:RNA polymerase primary sigma factor